MNTSGKKHVIALEWLQFGLGRLTEAAARQGLTVHLLTCDRADYLHELGTVDSPHLVVHDTDTNDVDAVVRTIRAIGDVGESGDVAGLISTTDAWSLVSLEVRARLGLEGQDSACVRLARDKTALRQHLFDHGLSSAPGRRVDPGTDDATSLAAAIGLPLIVKDGSGTGSKNVWLARNPAELDHVLEGARKAQLRGTLTAEPYFPGPLFSIETLTWQGETRVLGINSRVLSPPPFFREEATGFPVALPAGLATAAERWIERVLTCVGYTEGFAHTEFVLGADGFDLVEINPRLGGGLVGEELAHTFGIVPEAAFLDLVLRRRPRLMDQPLVPRSGTGQALVYAPRNGVFQGCDGQDILARHPGSPVFFPVLAPGTEVTATSHQEGVVGIVFTTGATAELALHNALSAAGEIRVRMKDDDADN
ncbi:ATP-grasp domain-containing protein [Streptomyces sp. NPDC050516]|uniref:ATP-grasp domain-containing protein n=1 Tax=Streptomyces sp. NPDC050516 TaxID=3365621 RepID=UPI00378D4267